MKKAEVIVVGGSAAGLTAAMTSRRHYAGKSVLLVRHEKQVPIPCGIPYVFGTVGSPEKNLIPDSLLSQNDIELLIADAEELDPTGSSLRTSAGQVAYERLIIATGSTPIVPSVPGVNLDGALAIRKDVEHLRDLQRRVQGARHVVVIGGGFIGIEFADEIMKAGGKEVTVIEILPHCLSLAYDDEFCAEMEGKLKERGIHVRTATRVEGIEGPGRVSSVRLSDGTRLDADLVILSTGASPNTDLARAAGLRIGSAGGIWTDRTMRTSNENIFACGDCAEKTSFFRGGPCTLKLASIATHEARVAGANLFEVRRESPGTVGAWSTAVGELALATAGLTESAARETGYRVVCASAESVNRHPGGMPGGAATKVKLVFEANSGVLLGGQVRGNASAGEIINTISALIQKGMTANDIASFQMGTHPALTASPISYQLVNAAEVACGTLAREGRG